MTAIVETVEIARSPDDVFAYLSDLGRHNEWTSFKVMDGPIRPVGRVEVEPLDEGARSRVTLELDFEGHGIGRLLLPLVRRDARKHVPLDQAQLKERLEAGV